MFETATTFLTALAMLGHSILGCHCHHDHDEHSGEIHEAHSASHPDAHQEHPEEISRFHGLLTTCEVPVGGYSDDEVECTYVKPRRTAVQHPIDVVASSAVNLVNVAGKDGSCVIASAVRYRRAALSFTPPVRALTSVTLL